MQATFSPLSFNGGLGDALKTKESKLELKKKHLEATQGTKDAYAEGIAERFVDYVDTFSKADKAELEGDVKYGEMVSGAKDARGKAKLSAKEEYEQGKIQAQNRLEALRGLADTFEAELNSVAAHSKQLADEAKTNLKEIGKTAKPLRAAVSKMAKSTVGEAEEVADSVKEAGKAVAGAKDALSAAMQKVAALEQKEEKLRDLHLAHADGMKDAAKGIKKDGYNIAKTTYLGKLAELKEEKAQALDDAKEAYREAIKEAKDVLQEYQDLSGADREKAQRLYNELRKMDNAVTKIKIQAMIIRATNLPNLAATAIGLGKIGEGATPSIVNRVVRTLTNPDWLASVKGKLGAIGAADLFLKEGSDNQKVAMGTGIELNANQIVEKTNSLEVIEELKALDQEVDKLNVTA
ncbi:MAG: hypothetical protein AB1782_15530 [Cyanobacteriota bacterium]